jgi:thiol-disulfide isomerase/thioredoxin
MSVALGLALGIPGAVSAQDVAIPVGTIGPDAAVQDLQGRPIQLRSLFEAGKPTVIEFWATWCGECEALQPQFDALQARYGDRVNVVAVAVAVGQTLRRVNDHLEDHNPGYPFVWDAGGAAVRAYQAPTTATVIVMDRQGRVVYTGVDRDQNILAQIERVLATD